MKEIGGYFELEELISEEYYPNLIGLNNGRNALLYLVKAKKIRKIYLPFYLCDSISNMCKKNNIEYELYNIDSKFMPLLSKDINFDEYIYIVNYFGQLKDCVIMDLKQKYKNIIVDNTQSFFQQPLKNIDTIYSCRKFFGVPDGSYLYTTKIIEENIDIDVSKDRMVHILGRYECDASTYYNDFKNNDINFKEEKLKYMSKLTHNILGAIDYDKVIQKRNENFNFLHENLKFRNMLEIDIPNAPFTYPFYVDNGVDIRKKLAEKKIYIPTLWPNVIRDMTSECLEYKYATNILPIPCDQRYNISDLSRLVEELDKCLD